MRNAHELFEWLLSRVRDGGNDALLEVSSLAENEDEGFIKSPCMAALLCWDELGCQHLVKIGRSTRLVKNTSGAMKLLSAAAAGQSVRLDLLFVQNEELSVLINASVANARLRQPARRYLMDLLQSLETDDILIPLGTAFTQMEMIAENGAAELVRAISSRWLKFGLMTITEYEELIVERADDELAFQQFFCQHPQFLDPMATQVWSRPDFHGAQEPDFVIRRSDNSYLVVEIETPGKLLVTQAGHLSADATHAEKQATDYRAFLADRTSEARRHFPYFNNAECLVVIGKEAQLTAPQAASLANANAGRHKVRIVGFDWLAQRANAIMGNLSSGEIQVIEKYRMI